jgi:hypothetical protein
MLYHFSPTDWSSYCLLARDSELPHILEPSGCTDWYGASLGLGRSKTLKCDILRIFRCPILQIFKYIVGKDT